ncbi:MAG: hypothetical protein ABFC34_08070 [Methanobacterium sp.]
MAKPNLPDGLAEEINLLKKEKSLGITSMDEFVRESVRINIERYQKMLDLKNKNRRDVNDERKGH